MKFEQFRHEHNEVRTHQSLNQRTPQDLYYRSAKNYDPKVEPWKYPEGFAVKYVCRNGAIRWGDGKWVMVSTTLIERYIGLEQIAEGIWRVYYRGVFWVTWMKRNCASWMTRAGYIGQGKKCKRCA